MEQAAEALDAIGSAIRPLDFVIISAIPEHYFSDLNPEESEALRSYEGGYGLVTFFQNEELYCGRVGNPGWRSESGDTVYVVTRAIVKDHLSAYDFWLPTSSVLRIEPNVFVQSIFADLPIELLKTSNQGSVAFVNSKTQQFELIRRILATPYETLKQLHVQAMNQLSR